ncbi:Alpha-2C adrenergic receptor [Amphibalanus amphitrite]|uniref:Alpha-2C adrenergic receptor n=1 Tax=Amphibalanus amphitrite TaxID=1232801 RepID=A0A6A4X0S6_AMPAM|nr:Alpha-2C adrenergic receptor [Amphibalanus amphitrite]
MRPEGMWRRMWRAPSRRRRVGGPVGVGRHSAGGVRGGGCGAHTMATVNVTPLTEAAEANSTNGTLLLYPWGESLYPSGYSTLRIVLTSVVVTLIMIVVVVGNMLVIIAIATEKALKGIQNWFIASLAVADFMVGLIIMPFSLAQELMGYWLFGELWCSLHAAIDVLACTSSINNICLISLDRYWSITQAVDYLKSRTPRRAIFMIAFVWLFSALICFPPLLGWRKKRVQSDFPKCEDYMREVIDGRMKIGTAGPIALGSRFGWIISGPSGSGEAAQAATSNFIRAEKAEDLLQDLWSLEKPPAPADNHQHPLTATSTRDSTRPRLPEVAALGRDQ